MIKKNDEIKGEIQSIGINGEGVFKADNITVFTPFAIDGEEVSLKILKVDKNIAYGKLVSVIKPSKFRIKPICPVFTKCGGCQLQHINYDKQLEIKKNTVKNAFFKVAGIDFNIKNTVPSDKIFGYRNKLQLPVVFFNGENHVGFYAENSHRVIDVDSCPINPDWTGIIVKSLKEYMDEFSLKGYDEEKNIGDIREITVKSIKGNLFIVLVVLKNSLPSIEFFIDLIKNSLKNEFSLYLNVNDKATNVIYGDKFINVYGKTAFKNQSFGINYSSGVQSFLQINDEVAEKLYSFVEKSATVDKNATIINGYSGAGVLTAVLAKNSQRAIGVEIVKEANDFADLIAKENGLSSKMTNYLGKCEDVIPKIVDKYGDNTVFVLDPPRKGCDIKVIKAIKDAKIKRIVYVSCKPSTLARDIGLLIGSLTVSDGKIIRSNAEKFDYSIESITPFDMFPQTKHVETVCVLKKN